MNHAKVSDCWRVAELLLTSHLNGLIYYKKWCESPVVTFSRGWPLSSDAWDGQICSSRRGASALLHTIGVAMADPVRLRPGTTMDGYADDLAAVIEALDLVNRDLLESRTRTESWTACGYGEGVAKVPCGIG